MRRRVMALILPGRGRRLLLEWEVLLVQSAVELSMCVAFCLALDG